MQEQVSSRSRRFLINGIIVFAIMLFIIGFYIGKSNEDKANENLLEETIERENNKEENEIDLEGGFSYSDLIGTNVEHEENESSLVQEADENTTKHGKYEHENPEVDFDEKAEREINILEDFFTKEEVEEAKKVSELFVKAFYSFNGTKPLEHIENALEFATESLQEEMRGQVTRPTHEHFLKEYKEVFVYEPYNPQRKSMILKVRVEGTIFNSEGEEVRDEILEYDLILVQFEDTFKIDKYTYRTFR